MAAVIQTGPLSEASFQADTHAAKYLSTLRRDPAAFERLLDLLNRPETARLLTSPRGSEPALGAIVDRIEADPVLAAAVGVATDSLRFRQAVGVAVRLRMEQLGWVPTGLKGAVRRSRYFAKAERYRPRVESAPDERALAALERVRAIGTEEERAATGAELQRDLRDTRRAAGRAF
jgi:hypothetical protein